MALRMEIEFLGKEIPELKKMCDKMLLSLNENEIKEMQQHYLQLKRNPTDVELETLAQTWSEHCKHKTFNADIDYTENGKQEKISSLFKTYIQAATGKISKEKKWLVSVFSDNAGIIKFNDAYDVAFKVETHNHPSALDPYGGANTGIGGVIRDILGAGMGAKPIANTDIFCFGMFDFPHEKLPKTILHPKRIAKGVRAGVRDYGNRIGIPTVNGAIIFDERYLGNPLVYCGTVGIIPKDMHKKAAKPGDLIVAIGGRTGRDGIHGATFSSTELEETTPSSPVQIGNPIEEKKFLDVLIKARDVGLYTAVTDCGAGGFSSAVGEMGEELGAEVHLEKAPLKYKGLLPWEIWISEAQERMVLAVPKNNIEKIRKMFEDEDVEVTILGEFKATGKLHLFYEKELVGELDMKFLHNGVPKLALKAKWEEKQKSEIKIPQKNNYNEDLLKLLAMPNIASKESTIRQYDHEVQGGSVLKPLMGKENDGPGDAAIVRPLLDSKEAVVISNGINPLYGDIDCYWMACSAIDEAIRNAVAVGADINHIALLDNFSWGSPLREETLGKLIRACKGCYDAAVAFGTPFISGKDSLFNEYLYEGKTISIPGTLLISALGVMKDAGKRVSMDLKKAGNSIYAVGATYNELGGSHYSKLHNANGGEVPKVRFSNAGKLFEAMSKATNKGLVRAAHDCSEGGIGVASAEMAFAGMLGAEIDLKKVPLGEKISQNNLILFSESNSRFLVEVSKGNEKEFEKIMEKVLCKKIGKVVSGNNLKINGLDGKEIVNSSIVDLKRAWKKTLSW